jgi:hypothetical protein
MKQIFVYTANVSGVTGALLCAVAGVNRVLGDHYVAGYEATTLFSVGTGLMVFACLLKLESMSRN